MPELEGEVVEKVVNYSTYDKLFLISLTKL
jgi:hypothetical protein